MWRTGIKLTGASALAYVGWDYYSHLTPLPFLTNSVLEAHESFLLYKPSDNYTLIPKIDAAKIPCFSIHKWFDPTPNKIHLSESSTGLHFVKKVNGSYLTNSLEAPEKFEKWVKIHRDPYQVVNTKKDLEKLLKTRNKHEFLDCFIAAYVPEGDISREKQFQDLMTTLYFEEPICNILASYASPYIRFLKVSDKALADELQISSLENMTFLRIKDSRGWFHSHRTRNSYADPAVIKQYMDTTLAENLRINGHELQLSLQIYFDRFTLSQENSPNSQQFNNIQELASAISHVNPLIVPLFTLKQLQLTSPKIFHGISGESSKVLVISLKKDHEEKSINEVQRIFQELKLDEFARAHPEIVIIMGYPEFIYHLPIRDIAIYHYEPIEVRLIDINNGRAVNSVFLDEGMQLVDLLNDEKPHMETSPPSVKQNAEIFTPKQFTERILNQTNRCYFVMNCSKTCPACSYQDIFFQEAALQSKTCKFVKYYVSNQSPDYKGPNATPRFHLYIPGKTEPIVYEPKIYGLKPENFLDFINTYLANLSQA